MRFLQGALLAAFIVSTTTAAPAAAQVSSNTRAIGDFVLVTAKDPIDDSNRSYIMTSADDDSGAAMTWRCMADGLNVVLNIGKFFAGDDEEDIKVITRLDSDDNSGEVNWGLLQGNMSASMPMSRVDAFTERAKTASQLAVRAIDPFDDETLTFIFTLEGFGQALEELLPCS